MRILHPLEAVHVLESIGKGRLPGRHPGAYPAQYAGHTAAVCSDTPLMRLTRDERRVIVADLAEQGMSTRAIAPVVGAGIGTVSRNRGV